MAQMVLQVAFEDFADTVRRLLGESVDAYVAHVEGETLATAAKEGHTTVVSARTPASVNEARTQLEESGLKVYNGCWGDDVRLGEELLDLREIYVAGVAYATESGPPGVWIDVYETLPTQVQVLRTMYEEMSSTGESAEVSFEEFVRMSNANVVITSPSDLHSYLAQKA